MHPSVAEQVENPISVPVVDSGQAAVERRSAVVRLVVAERRGAEKKIVPTANTAVHRSVFAAFVALNGGILAVFAMGFGGEAETALSLAICAVYLAMYVGTPYALSRIAPFDMPRPQPLRSFLREPFDTWTGQMSGRQVAIQILVIPAALLLATAGIAVAYRMAVD